MKMFMRMAVSVALVILLLFSFTSCGADGGYYDDSFSDAPPDNGAVDESVKENIDLIDEEPEQSTDERKIIETIEMTLQTKNFDALLDGIYEQVNALGGYVESSDISGNAYDAYGNRDATLTVRIPCEKTETFSGYISENSVITRRFVTTEDVTLKYVDMESRLSALKTERQSLEELLAKAETVEDIITVRDRLTEVIGEIESYTAQLRTLDNLVSYSTIDLNIWEVEKTAVVEKQSVWQRIGTGFADNLEFVGDAMVELFVLAVTSIPLFIPLAVALLLVAATGLIVYLIVRHAMKLKRK